MAAPLTEAAIEQVRQLIASGALSPGQRLPPEAELAESLGTSRNTMRGRACPGDRPCAGDSARRRHLRHEPAARAAARRNRRRGRPAAG